MDNKPTLLEMEDIQKDKNFENINNKNFENSDKKENRIRYLYNKQQTPSFPQKIEDEKNFIYYNSGEYDCNLINPIK